MVKCNAVHDGQRKLEGMWLEVVMTHFMVLYD
jgi:hypothetical protein